MSTEAPFFHFSSTTTSIPMFCLTWNETTQRGKTREENSKKKNTQNVSINKWNSEEKKKFLSKLVEKETLKEAKKIGFSFFCIIIGQPILVRTIRQM